MPQRDNNKIRKGDHAVGMCWKRGLGHETAVNKKYADLKAVHLSFSQSPAKLFAGGELL